MYPISHTTPRARKQHPCSECKRGIAKGEVYHRYFHVNDSGAYTHVMCERCDKASDWLTMRDTSIGAYGYVIGELWSLIREYDNCPIDETGTL